MLRNEEISKVEKNISALLEKEMINQELAGASICIIHNGQEIIRRNYGYANLEKRIPIENDTLFRIYSMGKPVAAVAAMILYERGELDLYEPLSDYLPEFREMKVLTENGVVSAKREILMRDLLSMTSGIGYPDADPAGLCMTKLFDKIEKDIKNGKEISTRELCSLVAEQPLAFHPGEAWRYGFNTDVLGAVMEVITGKTVGEFYKEEIFELLDMKDTGFYVPEEKQHRFAELYTYKTDGVDHWLEPEEERHLCLTKCLKPVLFESAGAGLVSTMDDSCKFVNMLTNYGTCNGKKIIGRNTFRLMTSNQLTKEQLSTVYFDHLKGYGYGSFMRILIDPVEASSNGTIGEFGWDGWTGPYFTANPQKETAIILMAQRCGYTKPTLLRRLCNIVYSAIE